MIMIIYIYKRGLLKLRSEIMKIRVLNRATIPKRLHFDSYETYPNRDLGLIESDLIVL
jgi:hypothetical protein